MNNIENLTYDEKQAFIYLYNLFEQSGKNGALNDFTLFTRNKVLFPLGNQAGSKGLTREAFSDMLQDSNYIFVNTELLGDHLLTMSMQMISKLENLLWNL